MKQKCILSILAFILLASCSTVPFARRESSVKAVTALVNAKDHQKLIRLSETPFLLDEEIIIMPGDVAFFWETALQNGLVIKEYTVESITPGEAEDYKYFSDSREIEIFFTKYVHEDSSIAKITSSSGVFFLLLTGKDGRYPRIFGFKGGGA